MGLLDRSEREEAAEVIQLTGFNPNQFSIIPVQRCGMRVGLEVIVSRFVRGETYTKRYSTEGRAFWLLALEHDLEGGAFGSPL